MNQEKFMICSEYVIYLSQHVFQIFHFFFKKDFIWPIIFCFSAYGKFQIVSKIDYEFFRGNNKVMQMNFNVLSRKIKLVHNDINFEYFFKKRLFDTIHKKAIIFALVT